MANEMTDNDKYWYSLGFNNGEAQLKCTLEKLRASYHVLFDELTRLDKKQPVVGVLLSYKIIKSMLKAIRKGTVNYKLAAEIQRKYDEARAKDNLQVLTELAEK